MRAASSALVSFLAAQRSAKDAPLLMADCYTFTLRSGVILTYTNADVPIAMNGAVFAANSVLVDGLTFKCTTGLDVDQQHISIAAQPTDTIGGVPFLIALHHGVFDGCELQRERAFLASWGSVPIGSVILFRGRVTSVDSIGRTSAEITVASDLVLLDLDMPRNLYQPTCGHTLYDSGCSLIKNAFGTTGTVGAGSTPATILWAGAAAAYGQGTITFSSGPNAGSSANVRSAAAGVSLTLSYPLAATPAAGDAFTIYQGCDHTAATCQAKFNNLANFRGFPFVPPPTAAY
ncbi:DUF2163 domain-containing protein [Beijerinckia sp. L45]|uniref:DUF2163 domain-containing protein n=1 Tax=Beijerinckia sp. L45 TaxID=1641855 RepID=UPI00131B4E4C|nr:DUF2163 domain-containing protein [Beijerinckia sp. L45]